MSTSLAFRATEDLTALPSEDLALRVQEGMSGIATKLVELRPLVAELWTRFDKGETIQGCATRKEFCDKVLHRSDRAVRYMLSGGNPDNKKSKPKVAEIISAPAEDTATPEELREYTSKFPNSLLENSRKLVGQWREFTEEDLVSALVQLQYKPRMARAAVRFVKAENPSPDPEPTEPSKHDCLQCGESFKTLVARGRHDWEKHPDAEDANARYRRHHAAVQGIYKNIPPAQRKTELLQHVQRLMKVYCSPEPPTR